MDVSRHKINQTWLTSSRLWSKKTKNLLVHFNSSTNFISNSQRGLGYLSNKYYNNKCQKYLLKWITSNYIYHVNSVTNPYHVRVFPYQSRNYHLENIHSRSQLLCVISPFSSIDGSPTCSVRTVPNFCRNRTIRW